MENVFDHLKETAKYKFNEHIDLSIKSCVSDPHNSILKTYAVLEDVVDELYKAFEVKKSSNDMYKEIIELKQYIDDDVINDMHQIRIIRNKAAHKKETSYDGTMGGSVDVAEAIITLKKLYDILGWLINLYNEPIVSFAPFQEVITDILDKSIERVPTQEINIKEQEIPQNISFGKFVQSTIIDLLEQHPYSEEEINSYTLNEYSLRVFGLISPFLSNVRSGRVKGRYYSKPARINGKRYYICNGWNDKNKSKLFSWLKSKQVEFGIQNSQ